MTLAGLRLSFIGAGNMAEAMINGLLSGGLTQPDNITATAPHQQRREELANRYHIKTIASNQDATQSADIIVLAVKPQMMGGVVAAIKGPLRDDALVISIAAGVTLATLRQGLRHNQVVRSMPNTPGRIGQGMTVWAAADELSPQHRSQTEQILGALGKVAYVDHEKYLDMATAVSGTGPAYVFFFLEAMIDAAVREGLPRHLAEIMVLQTFAGSAAYARQADRHLSGLRNDVTSPAGTTAAALYELERGGMRVALYDAVHAAHERSIALGATNGSNTK